MAQTLCLSDSDRETMAEAQDNIVQEGLKYLGYLFVALLTMLFGWIAKLVGAWITKKLSAYVERMEKAADRIDEALKNIAELKASDDKILKEIDNLKTSHEIHAKIQESQSRDISAIKKHLNLD